MEAPAPSRPIERGLAEPSLLAHAIVSKYADHLPLFREVKQVALGLMIGEHLDNVCQMLALGGEIDQSPLAEVPDLHARGGRCGVYR